MSTTLRGQKSTVDSTSCTAQTRFVAAISSGEADAASSTQWASWKVVAVTRLTTMAKRDVRRSRRPTTGR